MTKKSIERISKKRVIKINLEGPIFVQIYFTTAGVQNLFCKGWSAKFILQSLECKIYFATAKINNDPFFGNAPKAYD